ncbi:MAG: hypothetical protein H0V09_02930 [Gemmatimonadetes bacterium]|nr:hypothetical protein [Gemmatimonadota bacterium]
MNSMDHVDRTARPRLLVSVRTPTEVFAALEGGAEILDVKEPALGSLGRARASVVRAARAAAPQAVAVSAALGDSAGPGHLGGQTWRLEAAALPQRAARETPVAALLRLVAAGAGLLKVGTARMDTGSVDKTLRQLVEACSEVAEEGREVRLVAVAFADDREGAVGPAELADVAARAGCSGAMLDTLSKGHSILALLGDPFLRRWVAGVRDRGLLCGLAGSLSLGDVPSAAALAPDVIGLRGAVCRGGRTGHLSGELVRAARRALEGVEQ